MLGATPNLYMLSLLTNESLTSSTSYGGRITIGFGDEGLSGTASLRFQHPDTNITAHLTKRIHGKDAWLTGFLLGNGSFFSHAQDNGATSLTLAYALSASTPSNDWPTLFRGSFGVRGSNSWSNSYASAA